MIKWSHKVQASGTIPIVPDGCRDLILRLSENQDPYFFVSDLMTTTQATPVVLGEQFFGVRLPPGALIDQLAYKKVDKIQTQEDLIELALEFTKTDERIKESLSCIAVSDSPSKAAKDLVLA